MSELLTAAAAALGLPEPLVQRSAAARATETGMTVDEVLDAWAGGGQVATPAPAATELDEPGTDRDEVVEDVVIETPESAPADLTAPTAPTAPAAPAAPVAGPMPTEVNSREAARLPEVVTVPTAGIRERTSFATPRWLTTLLLAAPLFALFALGGAATGECGSATELRTDVITGEIVDCDGSEYTGRTPGGGGQDFVAIGGNVYAGSGVANVNCAACHGAQGEGGVGLPLAGVVTTFGSCTDHIEWVQLGSSGFTDAGRNTYGDTDKQVTRGMPGFAGTLSDEQVAAVVAFERVRFGGGNPDEVLVDCGLVEETDENGESGESGENGDNGEGEGEAEAAGGLTRSSS